MSLRPSVKAGAFLILVAQLMLTLVLGYRGLRVPMDNSINSFAPVKDPSERGYQAFAKAFGQGQVFMVTAVLDSSTDATGTAEKIFEEIATAPGISRYDSPANSMPKFLSLKAEQLPLPLHNGSYYSAVFHLDGPVETSAPIVKGIIDKILTSPPPGIQNLNLAGEPIVNHYLNLGSQEVKERFFPLLIVISLALFALWFRSLAVLLLTGLSVGSSLAVTTGLMALSGQNMNLITTLVPALVFVLAAAMQIHVTLAVCQREGDILAGLRAKFRANLTVTLTTAVGFASLTTSKVAAVADMGLFMMIGILIIFVMIHTTHLGLGLLLNPSIKTPHAGPLARLGTSQRYMRWVQKPVMLMIPLVLLPVGILVLIVNPVESNGLMYFKQDHPIRKSTEFLQANVTGATSVDILLAKDHGPAPYSEEMAKLEEKLLRLPHVRHLISLNSVAQMFPDPVLAGQMIEKFKPEMVKDYESPKYLRIQLMVNTMDAELYFLLKAAIITKLQEHETKFIITGAQDRVIAVQTYLLQSLLKGLSTTIVAVLLILLVTLGGPDRLAVVLIPNLFPLAMMACFMWLLGLETTIASVMVFSICFGIAVDDTIHLMHGFYDGDTSRFQAAWRRAVDRDGRAVWMTTLVLSSGFLVLISSNFLPTQTFGLLLAVGMVSALIGDLFFLPAALSLNRH